MGEVNKVVVEGETLIDLTEDTVTEEGLLEGIVAHAANGEKIVGALRALTSDSFIIQSQYAFNPGGSTTTDVKLRWITQHLYYADYEIKVPEGYELFVAFPQIAWFSANFRTQDFYIINTVVNAPSGHIGIDLNRSELADYYLWATRRMYCIFIKK